MAASQSASPRPCWWKESTVYQIYPSSFQDSNGDGIGDIPGIISRVPHLKNLGVDVVWLSPVYKSPGKDMGYDIEDYRDINPIYGTMADMDELIACLHASGIKLLMDLVVNHTSDQHEWFKESRSSLDNPKRKWYIWKDPKISPDGTRESPNNWLSVFGGSAWTYDETTSQYYLHSFHDSQPDLDWNHDPVRKGVHSLMKFWLDKGVNGFRMDVIDLISKAPGLPDAPIVLPGEKLQPPDVVFSSGPRLHEFLHELRTEVLDHYDTMTVGEMPWCHDRREVIRAVGADRGELDMIFEFSLVCIDFGVDGRFTSPAVPWTIKDLKRTLDEWQTFLLKNGGWYAIFLENHDQPRSYRLLDTTALEKSTELRERAAKMLAIFAVAQSGTVYLYQGQEIGMVNMPRAWGLEEYKDVETLNKYKLVKEEYGEKSEEMKDFMEQVYAKARDHARTPMQWNASPHAGFTAPEATPWMRLNDSYKEINVEAQVNDGQSVLNHWKYLLLFRKTWKDALVYGGFKSLDMAHEQIVAWKRTGEKETVLAVMNFGKEWVSWRVDEEVRELVAEGVVLWSAGALERCDGEVRLDGYGGVLLGQRK